MRKFSWRASALACKTSSAGEAVLIGVIALACLFFSATGARANEYSYTYTGGTFSTPDSSGPYTAGYDYIYGTIVLSAPLPDDLLTLTNESSLLVSYSFSVVYGPTTSLIQTLTNLNSTLCPYSTCFQFATGSSGDITGWSVGFEITSDDYITTYAVNTGMPNGEPGNAADFDEAGYPPDYAAYNTDAPGSWSEEVLVTTPPPSTTPEPSTLVLLVSGLAGLAGMCLRERRLT
jgi:hypothetical protein